MASAILKIGSLIAENISAAVVITSIAMRIYNNLFSVRWLFILIAILVITTAADMFSAMRLPIFKIAEANPIYVLTGSTMPLIWLNIFVVIWYSRSLKNSISIPKI